VVNNAFSIMIDRKEVIELQTKVALYRDQTAYVRLYRIYYIQLFKFSRSFVQARETAEEIVSDVFLQVWQMNEKLSGIYNLTVYLYTCTRYLSLNYLRKQKKQTTYFLDEEKGYFFTNDNPEQLYIASELVKKIDAVINRLPPRCRLIFKMIREDGLKYQEAATALDVSLKTIEAQMGIALKRMHQALRPAGISSGRIQGLIKNV
jgi:RNA polymerase sigma-70 factor (family 1)